jgi:hypothetical protein
MQPTNQDRANYFAKIQKKEIAKESGEMFLMPFVSVWEKG